MKTIDNKRDLLIQLMYSADIQGYDEPDLVANFWLNYPDIDINIQDDVNEIFIKTGKDIETNDNMIKEFITSSWTIDRLGLIERIILRLGITELFMGNDKKENILREYVSLAKRYGDNKSAGFINGMLNNIAVKFDL